MEISTSYSILNFLIIFLLSIICRCRSKYVEGTLNTQDDWAYLDRFCFLSELGELRYEIKYPKIFAVQNLYLYYDEPTQWPAVYGTKKTCFEKEAVLNRQRYQIVNLSTWTVDAFSYPGCQETYEHGDTWLYCSRSIKFNSYRERWWFLAVGNCNVSTGLYMHYKLWMTNGHRDEFWFYQFSADEFYILPTDIPFLLIEAFTLVVSIVFAVILRARQMFHTTYKLYIISLSVECWSLLFLCIAYGDYAKNGVGLRYCKFLGELFEAVAVLVFHFLLILMAKGYTITRGRLSKRGSIKISIFMTIYSLAYAAAFIYQARFFDPGLVTYLYESPAGYCLVFLRIVGWLWFCYAIYFTLVHYPLKRGFYFRFATFYSLWFWMGPCIIILANFVIGKWMREKIVNGVEKSVSLAGYLYFLYLTRPWATNINFPYHVRTTQVSSLNGEINDKQFPKNLPQNMYEASNGCSTDDDRHQRQYDIFTINAAADRPPTGGRGEEAVRLSSLLEKDKQIAANTSVAIDDEHDESIDWVRQRLL